MRRGLTWAALTFLCCVSKAEGRVQALDSGKRKYVQRVLIALGGPECSCQMETCLDGSGSASKFILTFKCSGLCFHLTRFLNYMEGECSVLIVTAGHANMGKMHI